MRSLHFINDKGGIICFITHFFTLSSVGERHANFYFSRIILQLVCLSKQV